MAKIIGKLIKLISFNYQWLIKGAFSYGEALREWNEAECAHLLRNIPLSTRRSLFARICAAIITTNSSCQFVVYIIFISNIRLSLSIHFYFCVNSVLPWRTEKKKAIDAWWSVSNVGVFSSVICVLCCCFFIFHGLYLWEDLCNNEAV
jgi:hypothetical protein